MAAVIVIQVDVPDIDTVLETFDAMKVYRSITGIAGTYVEISTTATRPLLEQGKRLYKFSDLVGEITYFYKFSYFHRTSLLESNLSEPQIGDDPATASIMSATDLKSIYLFGLDLTDDAGTPFPELLFEWSIRWAIGHVERLLDIRIRPTVFDQRYDYYSNDYQAWTIIQLREFPVISVEEVSVNWPADTNVITFPSDWVQLRKDAGQVNVVPTSGSLSQTLLTAGGSFLPLLASGRDFVPNILRVQYTAGFAEGEVPIEIRDLIGKLASFGPLNVAGDLIVGAGIASKSISLDGLSQSINTTSSATNSGYGARIGIYVREIKEAVPILRQYYKGVGFTMLG